MRKKSEDSKNGANRIISGVGFEKGKSVLPPRITTTLSSLVAKERPYQRSLFEDAEPTTALCPDITGTSPQMFDKNGREVSLTPWEIRVSKALTSAISFDDESTLEYTEMISSIDAHGLPAPKFKGRSLKRYARLLDIRKISRMVLGNANIESIQKVGEAIVSLADKKLIQSFSVQGGNGRLDKYEIEEPLISTGTMLYKCFGEIRDSRGKRANGDSSKKVLVAAEVIFGPAFLFGGTTSYFQYDQVNYFSVFKKNSTDLYARLLSDIEAKFAQNYRHYLRAEDIARTAYVSEAKERAEYQYRNCNDKDKKINEAVKAAFASFRLKKDKLIEEEKEKQKHYRASISTLKRRCSTDYESTSMQRKRFFGDLKKAIVSLVELGPVTQKSHITEDGENIDFYFDFDYVNRVKEVKKLSIVFDENVPSE